MRQDCSLEALQKLKPAFKENGTVTAGNASGINDGAAMLVCMSREEAEVRGLRILACIKGFGVAGVSPSVMGIGPVEAVRKALAAAGERLEDMQRIEANEAFSAQSLAVSKALGFDMSRVNVNGGAVALGHPIGASGARIVVTLVHELLQEGLKKGLATLCIGGGQGIAVVIEA